MQFYRFWARANEECETSRGKMDLTAYGYSNHSLDDALNVARERVRANASRREWRQRSDQDYYSVNSPVREEIVQELVSSDGDPAIISRNSYGCLVLNTPNVLFADIDQPKNQMLENPLESIVGFFKGLFGGPQDNDSSNKANDFEQIVVGRIERMIEQSPGSVIRLYRTYNGFRAVVVNKTIPTDLADSIKWLKDFGSDELYVSLCRSQDCYRARLSPKPWRCKMHQPTVRYPFADRDDENRFSKWLEEYENQARQFATCALIGNFGNGSIDQTCQQIIDVHDNFALNGNRPLA